MSDAVISPSALLTTVLTDDFEPGYLVFLGSLLEHNPWFDLGSGSSGTLRLRR